MVPFSFDTEINIILIFFILFFINIIIINNIILYHIKILKYNLMNYIINSYNNYELYKIEINSIEHLIKDNITYKCYNSNKNFIIPLIARRAKLNTTDTLAVINSLQDIAIEHLTNRGCFYINNFFNMKSRIQPATSAGIKNYFGQNMYVKAKPATRTVHIRVSPNFKKLI